MARNRFSTRLQIDSPHTHNKCEKFTTINLFEWLLTLQSIFTLFIVALVSYSPNGNRFRFDHLAVDKYGYRNYNSHSHLQSICFSFFASLPVQVRFQPKHTEQWDDCVRARKFINKQIQFVN